MNVSKEHLNYVPGIVAGLGMAINCFTSPGDKIMIMPPVYHPFAWLVKRNNRQLVECPLILEDGHYRMNLDQLRREKKGVRVLILCNPHNPGGVVWTREELEAVAEICAEDNILSFPTRFMRISLCLLPVICRLLWFRRRHETIP